MNRLSAFARIGQKATVSDLLTNSIAKTHYLLPRGMYSPLTTNRSIALILGEVAFAEHVHIHTLFN